MKLAGMGIVAMLAAGSAYAQCEYHSPVPVTIYLDIQPGTGVFRRHQAKITTETAAYFRPVVDVRFTTDRSVDADLELRVRRKMNWCSMLGARTLCGLFDVPVPLGRAYIGGPSGEVYVFRSHHMQEKKKPAYYTDLTIMVMRHEVGHLLGLDHNEEPSNVMHATVNTIIDNPLTCEQQERVHKGALALKNNL